MSRNRKNQSAAVRFGPPLKALFLCLFIAGSGIGYLWQKNQISELGKQIIQREGRLEELRRQNKIRTDHLAYLRSPRVLDQRVKELNLGLLPPQPEQILRLPDPVYAYEPASGAGDRQAAAKRQTPDGRNN